MAIEWVIKVDTNGNVESSVKGIQGTGCKELTKDYDRVVGKATSDKLTSEANATQRAYNQNKR